MEIQIRINKLVVVPIGFEFDKHEITMLADSQKRGFIQEGKLEHSEVQVCKPYAQNMLNLHKYIKTPKLPLDLIKLAEVDPNISIIDQVDQPDGFVGKLMPHQIKALSFSMSRRNSLLALDMGSGKTAITISIILACDSQRTLIVVPASLKSNWKSEFEKFAPAKTVLVLKTAKHACESLKKKDVSVFIVSYALVACIQDELKVNTFDIIIGDEAHYVKTASSNRAKVFKKVAKTVTKKVVLLTGTPGETHQQLYNLMNIIAPSTFKHFHHHDPIRSHVSSTGTFYFGERYCVPTVQHIVGGRKAVVFKQSQRARELQAVIAPHVLTMRKEDILDLPDLHRECITVYELDHDESEFFKEEFERIAIIRDKQGSLKADAALMELVRETMRLKGSGVCNYLKMLLETYSDKMIVFFHHSELRQQITESLDKCGKDYICVDGGTPMTKRSALFNRFKTTQNCKVAVLSLQACATGLNFQFVNLVLFAELLFSSTLHTQAEARSHRYGQTGKVLCQYLIANNSTDDMVLRTIKRKAETQSMLMSTSKQEEEEQIGIVWGESVKRLRFVNETENERNKRSKIADNISDDDEDLIPL